jgi:hypothetical protein
MDAWHGLGWAVMVVIVFGIFFLILLAIMWSGRNK